MIRETVQEVPQGRIRFQWWKDSIAMLYQGKEIPGHPILMILQQKIKENGLSKIWFDKILREREANLMNPNYGTVEQLEKYAENTQSSLVYLQLEALGIRNFQVDLLCSHIGKGIGMSTILRGIPAQLKNQRHYLPSELLAKVFYSRFFNLQHSLSSEALYQYQDLDLLEEVVFDIAKVANEHFLTAKDLISENDYAQINPAILRGVSPASSGITKAT